VGGPPAIATNPRTVSATRYVAPLREGGSLPALVGSSGKRERQYKHILEQERRTGVPEGRAKWWRKSTRCCADGAMSSAEVAVVKPSVAK
jgi:hypothetical protein